MGRKGSRYKLEEKLFYIGLVREDGWAPWAVQREYGVRPDQVRQWLERFEAAGVDGLKPRSIHQKYTKEFKLEIVQKYLVEHTSYPAALAREYGIPDNSVIVQWVSLYTSGQP